MKADYRKLNDHEHCSSTYHKKDGTPVRAILKEQLAKEVKFEIDPFACENTDTMNLKDPSLYDIANGYYDDAA